jgi:hypothetical protein
VVTIKASQSNGAVPTGHSGNGNGSGNDNGNGNSSGHGSNGPSAVWYDAAAATGKPGMPVPDAVGGGTASGSAPVDGMSSTAAWQDVATAATFSKGTQSLTTGVSAMPSGTGLGDKPVAPVYGNGHEAQQGQGQNGTAPGKPYAGDATALGAQYAVAVVAGVVAFWMV